MVRIFRVEAPDFVAAFLVRPESSTNPQLAEVVYHTAPKLRSSLKGKSLKNALKLCQERGWKVMEIKG